MYKFGLCDDVGEVPSIEKIHDALHGIDEGLDPRLPGSSMAFVRKIDGGFVMAVTFNCVYIHSYDRERLVSLLLLCEKLIGTCGSWIELFRNAAIVLAEDDS
jgi:hypothetical protein